MKKLLAFLILLSSRNASALPVHGGIDVWHRLAFYLCCALAVVVFIAMLYSLCRFRQSKKTHFHRRFSLEMLWTVIPFIILLALAFPAAKDLLSIHPPYDFIG